MLVTPSLVVGGSEHVQVTPCRSAAEALEVIRARQGIAAVPTVQMAYVVMRRLGITHTGALENIVFGATGALLREPECP